MVGRPELSDDNGKVQNAKVAFFSAFGDAHIRYAFDAGGSIHVLGIYAAEGVRGHKMVGWLKETYQRPMAVNEIAPTARGFWEKMQAKGLVGRLSEDQFKGRAVQMANEATAKDVAAIFVRPTKKLTGMGLRR